MSEPRSPRAAPCSIELVQGERYAWCACGRTARPPLCDGAHTGHGLLPRTFLHEGPTSTYSLCACLRSATAPFCDGSHRALPGGEDAGPDA